MCRKWNHGNPHWHVYIYSLLSIYVCYLIRSMEIIVSDFETVIPTNTILASLTDASTHLKIPHKKKGDGTYGLVFPLDMSRCIILHRKALSFSSWPFPTALWRDPLGWLQPDKPVGLIIFINNRKTHFIIQKESNGFSIRMN